MDNKLKNSIIKTLAFFDLFQHPLTKEEIYHWLWDYGSIDCTDFANDLDRILESGDVAFKQGYYFLSGREEMAAERQRRVMLVEEKMRIAVRGIKKLRWVPFVRAVFVCNTLAMGSVSKDSDIDVLIITGKGRIWLARFLCNSALKLFGLRTGKRGIKNKICLSFFADEDHLNLANLRIASPDVYLVYWLSQLMPIYDPNNIRKEIIKKNSWAANLISRGFAEYQMLSKYRVEDNQASRMFKKIWEKIWSTAYGNFLESQARSVQMAKLKMRRLENKEDQSVVFNNSIIKLHENDRRMDYQERWQRTLADNLKDVL